MTADDSTTMQRPARASIILLRHARDQLLLEQDLAARDTIKTTDRDTSMCLL